MADTKTCTCGGLERHRLLEDFLKEIRALVLIETQTLPLRALRVLSMHIARIDDFEARKAAEREATTVECTGCARKPGETNHPLGMVFVGFGIGWRPCPACGGSTRIRKEDAAADALGDDTNIWPWGWRV